MGTFESAQEPDAVLLTFKDRCYLSPLLNGIFGCKWEFVIFASERNDKTLVIKQINHGTDLQWNSIFDSLISGIGAREGENEGCAFLNNEASLCYAADKLGIDHNSDLFRTLYGLLEREEDEVASLAQIGEFAMAVDGGDLLEAIEVIHSDLLTLCPWDKDAAIDAHFFSARRTVIAKEIVRDPFGRFGPNRQHALLVFHPQYMYCAPDGIFKIQRNKLNPQSPRNKNRLLRFVILLDIDTGLYYGEVHCSRYQMDLACFLARAWSKKDGSNPFWGMPNSLLLTREIFRNPEDMEVLNDLLLHVQIPIGGIESDISLVRECHQQFNSKFYGYIKEFGKSFSIWDACSLAPCWTTYSEPVSRIWAACSNIEPPTQVIEYVEALYGGPDWRSFPFHRLITKNSAAFDPI